MQHPIFEIETKIKAYLSEGMPLDDLRSWFGRAKGPLLALPAYLQVSRQAGLLELGLTEMRDGALAETEFRTLLEIEVDTALHHVVEGNPELTFSASPTTTHSHSVESATSGSAAVLQQTLTDIPA